MLDVHPPHETPHGVRDFALHLFTITIGLLIALSLEGMLEWQHHRHLVREAEESMGAEIRGNGSGMGDALADLHKQQASLKHDVAVLKYIIKTGKPPEHDSMEISFHIHTFDDVAWKTAQTTGALAYMSYPEAEKYASVYSTQVELAGAETQAARDAILALSPFMNDADTDPDPTSGQASAIKDKLETLQGQLLLVDSFMQALDREYKKFPK